MSGGVAYTGTGRADNPVERGGLCAAKGCPELAISRRVSVSGNWVSYCYSHELAAFEAFGDSPIEPIWREES